MTNLPKKRLLIYDKPFASTGVDYFGPFLVKHSKTTRRNQVLIERYGVIYYCLPGRAIHLELAGYLSIHSFFLSLSHFISRRGHVKIMKSDNGTNFMEAAKELKKRVKYLRPNKASNFSNSERYQMEI